MHDTPLWLHGWLLWLSQKLVNGQRGRARYEYVTLVDKHIISIQKSHVRDLCLPFAFTCQWKFESGNYAHDQNHDFLA
jgi:hypothetical protein